MSNVVEFTKPEPQRLIWVCNCGCTTHYHGADGLVECGSCEVVASGLTGEWRVHLPPEPDEPQDAGGCFKIYDLANAETFLKRHSKDAEAIVAIVVMRSDGGLSTWANGEQLSTPEQREWLDRRLEETRGRLTSAEAR